MPVTSSSRGSAHPRVSQRQPRACLECTRRKVKCDKRIPCSRCHRLGNECTRELVLVRKQVTKHASEITFLKKLALQLEASGLNGSCPAARDIEGRISLLQSGDASESVQTSEDAPDVEGNDSLEAIQVVQSTDEHKENDATMVTVLEYLAWGRHYGACYPHRTCSCHAHRSQSELISISSIPMETGRSHISLLKDWSILPSTEDAMKIIQFHTRHLAWHHNCFHAPTFTEQCDSFWRLGTCDHPLWMALYLSILSSSIWCAQNSRRSRATLGIKFTKGQSMTLFRAMVDVLHAGNFLEDLSLYSVQAIAISTEVAHNLGLSNLNATLSSAGVRIAQCLGLHKISDRPSLSTDPSEIWHETIERETGKRVWCQIVIQDHFATPFTDSYCINPSHFSTNLPMNCDDHDMVERDDSVPTISSYARTLGRLASLIPSLLDDLGPLRQRNSLHEQYRHVIKTDLRMRDLVASIPTFLLRQGPNDPDWIPWLDIARRSLAITAADKIIMIHRPFLFQSFQTSQYAYTRNTCVSAAITILREHQRITDSDSVSIWTHSAFCVTAAMVLGLELLYPRQDDSEKLNRYLELVIAARGRLENRLGDVMADRGVRLIDTILQEREQQGDDRGSCLQSVDFHKVLARFLSLDDPMTVIPEAPDTTQLSISDLELPFPIVDDFDIWLNEVFGYDQV